MRLNIKVHPNSGRQGIIKIDDKTYEIYLRSNPKDNKANIEAVKLLSKYFNSTVKIIRGKTSRRKVIEFEPLKKITQTK